MDKILLDMVKAGIITNDDNAFDDTLLVLINRQLAYLNSYGVSIKIFSIEKDTMVKDVFDSSIDESLLQLVIAYIIEGVKIVFDPPQNSFLVAASESVINKIEWSIINHSSLIKKEDINENLSH